MSPGRNGKDESEPEIGAERLDEFFRELRQAIIELEEAYEAGALTKQLSTIDLQARFGTSISRAYRNLARDQGRRFAKLRDPDGRRRKTVHDLLTQMREELFEINTWFHAEIVSTANSDASSLQAVDAKQIAQSFDLYHHFRVTENVDHPVQLRLDQIIAGRSWGIGFVFDDKTVTDRVVALMTGNALRRFARDLQDLATVLPRVLRGDPDRFPQLIPPRSGRAFEQVIADILNEEHRRAQLSGLCEDYLQKTDLRVNYPDLDRNRGARVQVTTASTEENHAKKVDGIRHPEEFVILSPWSLAMAVPQIGEHDGDPHRTLFAEDLIQRFWQSFSNPPSDLADLAKQLRKMLCGHLEQRLRDPRGPMAEVPAGIREFIRVWVHSEALRSTKALREREAVDGRYRRGRDGRLRMRRLPKLSLSESSRVVIGDHPAGSMIRGKVSRIGKQCAWVEFADDLHGRIDRKEISWSDSSPDLHRYLNIGSEYEFKVRRVNIANVPAIIELSLKRTLADPWHQDNLRSLAGLGAVDGKVARWTTYGAFVEIKPDLVGLLHHSQLPESESKDLESRLPVGATIRVMIESIDIHARRMSLVPAEGSLLG